MSFARSNGLLGLGRRKKVDERNGAAKREADEVDTPTMSTMSDGSRVLG